MWVWLTLFPKGRLHVLLSVLRFLCFSECSEQLQASLLMKTGIPSGQACEMPSGAQTGIFFHLVIVEDQPFLIH